jgi:hypothetical protein
MFKQLISLVAIAIVAAASTSAIMRTAVLGTMRCPSGA